MLSECDEPLIEFPQCTKCGKLENDIALLHKHLLDCGGDTEWLKMINTTKSPNSKKSRLVIFFCVYFHNSNYKIKCLRKNWRPFNFRKRKNGRARHGLKRTPPTPPLPVVKTKPGDGKFLCSFILFLHLNISLIFYFFSHS